MKRLSVALLATVVGAGSILAFAPNAQAESRHEEYCEHHWCGRNDHDRDWRRDHDRDWRRDHDRDWRRDEHARRWYDYKHHVWRYEYR
jgi:Ni/Co efflux regulator RcnB